MTLTELETLAKKATPGPYESEGVGVLVNTKRIELATDNIAGVVYAQIAETGPHGDGKQQFANAAFIAACSPETILALVRIARAAADTEKYATTVLGFGCGTLHENDISLKQLRSALKGISQ